MCEWTLRGVTAAGCCRHARYIELCVFIGTARNTYAEFDPQHRGQVTFSFDQFLYAANKTNML